MRAAFCGPSPSEIYSPQNAADAARLGIKFTSPTVAEGNVFGRGHGRLNTANPQGERDVGRLKQNFQY